MKKIIGCALLAVPFVTLAALGVSEVGALATAACFALVAITLVIIWGGVSLLNS